MVDDPETAFKLELVGDVSRVPAGDEAVPPQWCVRALNALVTLSPTKKTPPLLSGICTPLMVMKAAVWLSIETLASSGRTQAAVAAQLVADMMSIYRAA